MFSCLRRYFCTGRRQKSIKKPYILQLTDDKYYIGESENIKRRIWIHENGNGSAWTKKYNVIKSIEPEHRRFILEKSIDEQVIDLFVKVKTEYYNFKDNTVWS